ncbi:MAG: glycosyltransferase [Anaerolineae bacterium]|nr:glycosyltransferase [Anaerolineae bacterium]
MPMILNFLTIVYVVCAVLLSIYALGTLVLLIIYLRHRHDKLVPPQVQDSDLPKVAVQLPIYNEMYVIERLIDACANLDYPRDRLYIQVLDDSNDETVDLVARKTEALREQGVNIQHIRRPERKGYKAGALAYGLELLREQGVELVTIFDADFMPQQDFLRQTVPFLMADSSLGMVQARWGHLNRDDSILTRWQAVAVDGHFVIEQTARNRAGLLMNFNGTGGVWRIAAIDQAGGWHDDTLTEDLDLSYRAQLEGWHFLYLPDVVVPGELPPHIAAFKQQQARWAKGSIQCMVMLLPQIWRCKRVTMSQRMMATMHLCQYLVHPFIIMMLLITPILLITRSLQSLPLGPLGFAWIAPPLVFVLSQQALYGDWKRRVLELPALVAFGTGIAWTNSNAVISGLFGQKGEFKRTPKYAQKRNGNKYALTMNRNIYFEMFLCAYALWGASVAIRMSPTIVPYLLMYAFAFGMVALWGVRDVWVLRHAKG